MITTSIYRQEINNNIENLNMLNKYYNWIPNEYTIRPSLNILALKKYNIEDINLNWHSIKDYIFHYIFNRPYYKNENYKNAVLNHIFEEKWIFSESQFRYNLPDNSNHYILWNNKYNMSDDIDNNIINNILVNFIFNIFKHDNFNYVYYKNPKPTINEIWHIQVFFIQH
jgi:hypothetical protein